LDREERGSNLGIKVLLRWTERFGRGATRFPLQTTAAYYSMFGGEARRASLDFIRRVKGEAGMADVYRHILHFAQCTLDRVYLLKGRDDLFQVTCTGKHHLDALARERKGAILLGAHLGSFEAARVIGTWQDLQINLLVHFENARRINAFLREVSPGLDTHLIEVTPGDVGHVFEVQRAIERGELVAIAGDRTGLNERTATADFFGQAARFPAGPYVLASTLGCPVYLTFGLYHEPNRYDLYCEPFADPVELPRRRRAEAIAEYADAYAKRLEHYCRIAPYNWFNFFDFWADAPG
jgi:predicted LPLAT superfamily acyltransferase